jgi:hypothetical protein
VEIDRTDWLVALGVQDQQVNYDAQFPRAFKRTASSIQSNTLTGRPSCHMSLLLGWEVLLGEWNHFGATRTGPNHARHLC